MNPSDEQYFFDLATKVIANRASDGERQEFEALLNQSSDHRERFEVFKTDLIVAKDIVSLIDAADATGAGLNEKQLERLQRDVDEASSTPGHGKSYHTFYLIILLLGLLFALAVGIFINISSNRTLALTADDISTPDEIIKIVINTLNNR